MSTQKFIADLSIVPIGAYRTRQRHWDPALRDCIRPPKLRLDLRCVRGKTRSEVYKIRTEFSMSNGFPEVSFTGEINYRGYHGAGQCQDEMQHMNLPFKAYVLPLLRVWKKYHMNDMSPYVPEQQECLDLHCGKESPIEYKSACEILKEHGKYEVEFTATDSHFIHGICINPGDKVMYKAGYGWVHIRLTDAIIDEVLQAAIPDVECTVDLNHIRSLCRKYVLQLSSYTAGCEDTYTPDGELQVTDVLLPPR